MSHEADSASNAQSAYRQMLCLVTDMESFYKSLREVDAVDMLASDVKEVCMSF